MEEQIEQLIAQYEQFKNMDSAREKRWITMFNELRSFKLEHGHANVPAKYEKLPQLGYWCRLQRSVETNKGLDPMRKALLEYVGFSFRLMEMHDWETMFTELVQFKEAFGHLRITQGNAYTQLCDWLTYQRKLYWSGKLEASKLLRLKKLGVDMQNKTLNAWETKFEMLRAFKKQNGHLYVSLSFGASSQLLNFVKVIRRDAHKLSEEKRKLLNDIGFSWKSDGNTLKLIAQKKSDEAWMLRFEELKTYKYIHGHCRVPAKSMDYSTLGTWVSVQRNKELSKERRTLLESIGFFDSSPAMVV